MWLVMNTKSSVEDETKDARDVCEWESRYLATAVQCSAQVIDLVWRRGLTRDVYTMSSAFGDQRTTLDC